MTERTWILLIICITVICLDSIVADCCKAGRRKDAEDRGHPKSRPRLKPGEVLINGKIVKHKPGVYARLESAATTAAELDEALREADHEQE